MMNKKEPVCSRNLAQQRDLMKKNRARKIAKRFLAVASGKNLDFSSSSRLEIDSNRRFERSKLGGGCSVGESGCCFADTLIQNHWNFRKSAPPSRLMFFSDGLWNDFPESVFDSMREAFVGGKTTVLVVVEGCLYVVDFLRMLQIDLKYGNQRSIAWVDETGRCFFPKFVVERSNNNCKAPPNLKVDIEVRIGKTRESESLNTDAKSDHSLEIAETKDKFLPPLKEPLVNVKVNDVVVKKCVILQVDDTSHKRERSPSDHSEEQIHDSHVDDFNTQKRICVDKSCDALQSGESSEAESSATSLDRTEWPKEFSSTLPMEGSRSLVSALCKNSISLLGNMLVKLKEGDRAYVVVKNLFLAGIRKFAPETIITGIYRCSHGGPLGYARSQAFQRQVEMTKAARCNANVTYAWYGTSAKGIASIVMHGFGQPNGCLGSKSHGVGVYLSPVHSSHTSASSSEPDENEERHIIFCRVIMGNPEEVKAGSTQFHPSSEQFDSGFDHLKNPTRYIVWSTHMNRHILPEYIVSFKSSFQLQGSRRTVTMTKKAPSGSNMSFPNLFLEMEKLLPPSRIQELECLYAGYKNGRIEKNFLIRQVRSIAGDVALISAIHSIRRQL